MKTFLKPALIGSFLLSFNLINAQEDFLTRERSIKTIERAVKLHEEEKYDEAVAEFKKVHRNDSNYYLASVEILNTYLAQKKYQEGLDLCDHLLKLKNDYTPNILIFKGDFLDNLKRHDEAYKVYEKGAKDYPLNNSFYFEMAIAKMGQKKFNEAYPLLIKSIKINPFHAASHQQMGMLAYRNGNITSTMLALQFYFICDPSSKRAGRLVGDLEKIAKMELEADSTLTLKAFEGENDFTEIESILKSKVALTKKYKARTDLTYDLVKQMQVVIENIGKYSEVKGFYNEFYGKFFADLQNNKFFEPYVYYSLSGMELEQVTKWISKNKSDMDKFETWAYNYLCENMANYPENMNGSTVTVPHWTSNNRITAAGKMNAQRNNEGYWKFYYSNGIKRSEGEFINGNKNNNWKFYYTGGDIKEDITYDNGAEKLYKSYYENNNQKVEIKVVNDKIDGIRKGYFSNGYLSSETEYKNGEINGMQTYYYKNGSKRYSIKNVKGIISGDLVENFDNGKVYQKVTFVNGLREGASKTFFNNVGNTVESEGNFVKGKRTGDWKNYYRSGKLYKESHYDGDGDLEGTMKTYYENGKLSAEEVYANNKYNGVLKYYSEEGNLLEEFVYKKGKLMEYRAFKNDGTKLCDNKINGKNFSLVLYHPNGTKKREGKVSDGDLDGVWKDYNPFGVLTTENNYKDGQLDGKQLDYYNNGKIKKERIYVNGNEKGYYRSYYLNGNPQFEGMIVDGNKEGYWIGYYSDGSLSGKYYYLENELDGWYERYDVNGRLNLEELYKEGIIVKIVYHDTTGAVLQNLDFPGGNGLLEKKNINGQVIFKRTLVKDSPEGISTTYHGDGKLESQVEYKNGKKEGKQLGYNPFGVLTSEVNYFNDDKNGHEIIYSEDGKKLSDYNYESDELNGKCFNYHPNGKVFKDLNYDYGDAEGESNLFDETGELIYKRKFHNDLLVSYTYKDASGQLLKPMELKSGDDKVVCYFQNGKKSFEATYSNGDLNGKRIIYYANGKVMEDTEFTYDSQNGVSKDYYSSGVLKQVETYYYGSREGKLQEYYENGKLKFEGNYKKGTEHGLFKYYDNTGKLIKTILFYNGDPVFVK